MVVGKPNFCRVTPKGGKWVIFKDFDIRVGTFNLINPLRVN